VLKVFALIGNVPVRSLQQQDCPALQGEVLRPTDKLALYVGHRIEERYLES